MKNPISTLINYFTCATTDYTTTGMFTQYETAVRFQAEVMMWSNKQTPYLFAPCGMKVVEYCPGFYTLQHKLGDSLVVSHVYDIFAAKISG